jgi:hypothetical protein
LKHSNIQTIQTFEAVQTFQAANHKGRSPNASKTAENRLLINCNFQSSTIATLATRQTFIALHPQAQANTTIFHHTKTAKSD